MKGRKHEHHTVNLHDTCAVLCFQVWPTVCWPLCHPGTDSSPPSSPSSFTFSWAPLGTSQWVRPVCAVCCECVRLCPCPGSTNLLFSLSLSEGPFPVLCLMIGSVVTRLVPDEGPAANITGFEGLTRDEQRVLVASSVTFLAGIMQVKCTHHNRSDLPQTASTAK